MVGARPNRSGLRGPAVGRRPLDDESSEFLLLLVGHLVVFGLSLSHDEIVAALVERGHVLASFAERFELLIGLALFIVWSALSVRLVGLVRRVRDEAPDRRS